MAYRHGAQFVMDWRLVCSPIDRNFRAKVLHLAEALEQRTKPAGRRNGQLGYVGLAILRALLLGFANNATGLCCPSYNALQDRTGLCRQSVANGLARLERCGIVRIVRRLCRVDGRTRQATSLYTFSTPGPWADHLRRQCERRAPFPDKRQLDLLQRMALLWKVSPSLSRRKEPHPRVSDLIASQLRATG